MLVAVAVGVPAVAGALEVPVVEDRAVLDTVVEQIKRLGHLTQVVAVVERGLKEETLLEMAGLVL
jgi:hypothetical protein